jgi:hypothetical protein
MPIAHLAWIEWVNRAFGILAARRPRWRWPEHLLYQRGDSAIYEVYLAR